MTAHRAGVDVMVDVITSAVDGDEAARLRVLALRDKVDWQVIWPRVLRRRPEGEATLRALRYAHTDALNGSHNAREPKEAPSSATPQLRILTDAEMEEMPTPTGIVEGVITAGSHAALVGPPGCGKGLIALDMLCSLALRAPWQGIPTKGGACVYLAAEKARLNGPRLRAWKDYHGVEGSIPIRFLPDHISLIEGRGYRLVIDALHRVMDELGEPVVALTIDTLAKTILPGDENNTAEMGMFLLAIQRIREATGCFVLTQHHMNAGGERERGNTSLRGDVDMMIFAKNEDGLVRLSCEKSNSDDFDPISLRVLIHSPAALVVTATQAWQYSRQELSLNERQALESLPRDFFEDGASATAWAKACGVAERSFYRVAKSLVSKGYAMRVVRGRSAHYKITASGQDAITETTAK
jgi:hypothetical protein